MKSTRIILQFIIICFGGVVLAILFSQKIFDVKSTVIVVGLIAFLFSLTLILKEETYKRTIKNHKKTFSALGTSLLILGSFGLFYGVSYLIGTHEIANDSNKCRVLCSLILLVSQNYGELAGKITGFVVYVSMGLFLFVIGYIVKNAKET